MAQQCTVLPGPVHKDGTFVVQVSRSCASGRVTSGRVTSGGVGTSGYDGAIFAGSRLYDSCHIS